MAPASKDALMDVTVRVAFGDNRSATSDAYKLHIKVKKDGSDSVFAVKDLIASAAGGSITASDLLLSFGPNDRKIGKQYQGDPTVDESKLHLSSYSVLAWIERFPGWSLSARLLPAAPVPPGNHRSFSPTTPSHRPHSTFHTANRTPRNGTPNSALQGWPSRKPRPSQSTRIQKRPSRTAGPRGRSQRSTICLLHGAQSRTCLRQRRTSSATGTSQLGTLRAARRLSTLPDGRGQCCFVCFVFLPA